jgi:hypothetical protein
MKLTNQILNTYPFLLGTWVLRATNDKNLKDGFTFLVLHDDNTIKLKTIYSEGIFGIKNSRSGYIENITKNNNTTLLDIKYNTFNKYSHSIFGIQIPEIKSENNKFLLNKQLYIQIIDNSLLIKDLRLPLYYLFDLQIGKIKSPLIETQMNTLIFTQLISFILNLFLVNFIHLIIKDICL